MLNSIWFFMIALSVVSALATGRIGSIDGEETQPMSQPPRYS